MFKTIDFRALTAITLFLLALLFSLPNLVIAMLLMLLISALLELIRMLAQWQPAAMGTRNRRVQLFSFKKLLFRSDGLDLRCFNVK